MRQVKRMTIMLVRFVMALYSVSSTTQPGRDCVLGLQPSMSSVLLTRIQQQLFSAALNRICQAQH